MHGDTEAMATRRPDWRALLIGGPSGVGKTIAAKQIGLQLGISWLHVDDLRLALQHSQVSLPNDTDALYFFEKTPDVWRLPPERLCESLIATAQVMSAAIEIVVANHVDTEAPVVIEGDGILPSLFARPMVHGRVISGQVAGVFLVEPDEDTLRANIRLRGRGTASRMDVELRTEARAKWLYGQWLATQARSCGLPVLEAQPWETLAERIVAANRNHF